MTAHPNDARRLGTLRFVESRRGQAIFASDDGTPIAVSACGDALRLRIGRHALPDYKLLANTEGEAVKVALAGEAAWRVSAGDLTLTLAAAPLRISLARRGQELLPSSTDEQFRGSTRLPNLPAAPPSTGSAKNLDHSTSAAS